MGNYGFTVIDGDMKYVDPSGAVIDVAEGKSAFYVTITMDDSGDVPAWSSDKTFSEIKNAYDNGSIIYAVTVGDDVLNIMTMRQIAETWAGFQYVAIGESGSMMVAYAEISEIEGETVTEVTIAEFDLSSLIVE